MSKKRSLEEFGRRLDSNYSLANKVFWQTIRRLRGKSWSNTTSIKDSTGNIHRDEKILSRWGEYFGDLLNPVRATPTDTCDTIDFGNEEVFTLTKVAAAIRGLKSEKAAGEDEIRPEMLKALNRGVRWLTRVCQVAWKFGKTPNDWQTRVIIPIYKKGDRKECTNYRGISLLSLPGKVYVKCLKKMLKNGGIKVGKWPVWSSSRSQHHGPNFHSEVTPWEILGVCKGCLRLLCWSRKGIRPGISR